MLHFCSVKRRAAAPSFAGVRAKKDPEGHEHLAEEDHELTPAGGEGVGEGEREGGRRRWLGFLGLVGEGG